MQRFSRRILLSILGFSTIASLTASGQGTSGTQTGNGNAVFAMTNDATRNEIVAYQRTQAGLFEIYRLPTGGRGSGGVNDPLQSQGSLVFSQDYSLLYAANAGSGTISVFKVKGAFLTMVDKVSSGGSEPLAIAESRGSVYVLNGAAAGSVVGFQWTGIQLRRIPNSTVFLSGTSAGGSSITISMDGKTLAVTERLTNSIDTFKINSNGTLGPIVVNAGLPAGVFSARFAPNGALIVSETGPAGAANGSTISSYTVQVDGTLAAIGQTVPTLGAANCWNAITPNGQWVYTSNAGSSNISGFAIAKNGALTPLGSTIVGTNPPNTGNLDMVVSADGNYLYTLNSAAGSISVFTINKDGSLTSNDQVTGLPKNAGFNGIAAN